MSSDSSTPGSSNEPQTLFGSANRPDQVQVVGLCVKHARQCGFGSWAHGSLDRPQGRRGRPIGPSGCTRYRAGYALASLFIQWANNRSASKATWSRKMK